MNLSVNIIEGSDAPEGATVKAQPKRDLPLVAPQTPAGKRKQKPTGHLLLENGERLRRSAIDRTGKRYGRLVAVRPVYKNSDEHICWEFRCDCGGVKIADGGYILSVYVPSCGCVVHENAMKLCEMSVTHGQSSSVMYGRWSKIISRCYNSNAPDFHRYGGRGIIMCDRWRNSFENFLSDMGEPPFLGATIERINNNGNYEPANCRWATQKEQSRNTRRNKVISINGITKTLVEWTEVLNLNYDRVKARLNQLNWTPEEAFFTPKQYVSRR